MCHHTQLGWHMCACVAKSAMHASSKCGSHGLHAGKESQPFAKAGPPPPPGKGASPPPPQPPAPAIPAAVENALVNAQQNPGLNSVVGLLTELQKQTG